MELVQSVERALAFKIPLLGLPGDRKILVSAIGTVPTSGWSHATLSPHYYVDPPKDGIWEFSFVADPPTGAVLDVVLPIAAATVQGCPDWVQGVKILAAGNSKTVKLDREVQLRQAEIPEILKTASAGNMVYSDVIAVYDDSFQPIGFCSGFPPRLRMKKLRHELTLTITGPDEAKIRRCVGQAAAAGLIAAIVAAFVTGGAALPAAISAALASLKECLGSSFQVRFDDRSHWIEWCT